MTQINISKHKILTEIQNKLNNSHTLNTYFGDLVSTILKKESEPLKLLENPLIREMAFSRIGLKTFEDYIDRAGTITNIKTPLKRLKTNLFGEYYAVFDEIRAALDLKLKLKADNIQFIRGADGKMPDISFELNGTTRYCEVKGLMDSEPGFQIFHNKLSAKAVFDPNYQRHFALNIQIADDRKASSVNQILEKAAKDIIRQIDQLKPKDTSTLTDSDEYVSLEVKEVDSNKGFGFSSYGSGVWLDSLTRAAIAFDIQDAVRRSHTSFNVAYKQLLSARGNSVEEVKKDYVLLYPKLGQQFTLLRSERIRIIKDIFRASFRAYDWHKLTNIKIYNYAN